MHRQDELLFTSIKLPYVAKLKLITSTLPDQSHKESSDELTNSNPRRCSSIKEFGNLWTLQTSRKMKGKGRKNFQFKVNGMKLKRRSISGILGDVKKIRSNEDHFENA